MIITVAAQKGGVGKSTTVLQLGAGLRQAGKTVLYIDADAQGNLSQSLQAAGQYNCMDLFTRAAGAQDAIIKTAAGDVIKSSRELATADIQITATGKEYRLKEALDAVKSLYDYILIDTPPALGIITVNALTAADKVIIPAQTDTYSLQSIGEIYQTIKTVQQYTNRDLIIAGIVISRYNGRTVVNRDIADSIAETAQKIGTKAYKTRVRECNAIREAQVMNKDIFSYAPKSNAAADFKALTSEILKERANDDK